MQSAAMLPEDAVLADALLGGVRVLDRVAAAGVEQAVEAPARALGQVEAVDEHHVEAAQRRVPGHAGARGAATDHQDVGAERGHGVEPYRVEGGRCGPPSTYRAPSSQLAASNQSNVRVTALFQYL